ncbi:hypothetical protein [Ovoidimarina sediminis]|uniref:hypothetical protein n=1 Tax=Ovoidimarina sediminis TaxID=3079856 RepID=UPI00290EA716|nr:hypothetical protein [Rhodophyticola sp. MJ-SS7]MDU8943753.1 hypothetical protein [Rhodophyticola sp. MJ-SS7]
MGLKKLAAKVADYNARLDRGAAGKIKPGHVRKVLRKLTRKSEELEQEIAATTDPDRKASLAIKLDVARQHIERAKWLLEQLD